MSYIKRTSGTRLSGAVRCCLTICPPWVRSRISLSRSRDQVSRQNVRCVDKAALSRVAPVYIVPHRSYLRPKLGAPTLVHEALGAGIRIENRDPSTDFPAAPTVRLVDAKRAKRSALCRWY